MTEGPTYHDPVTGRPYRVGPDGVSHWVTTEPPVPPAGPPASTGYPSGPPGQPGHPYPTGQPAWQPGPVVPAAPSSRPSRQLVLVLAVVAGVAVLLVIVLALVLVLRGGSSPARSTSGGEGSAPGVAAGGSGGSAADPGPSAPGPGSSVPVGIATGWRPADFRPLSNATGSANGVQVTVEGTGTVSRTGGASPRIAVGTFLLLYVTLTNSGSVAVVPFGKVTDTAGRTYEEDAAASGSVNVAVYGLTPVSVAPGKSIRRVIAVDVPPGTQATQLSVNTGFTTPPAVAPLR